MRSKLEPRWPGALPALSPRLPITIRPAPSSCAATLSSSSAVAPSRLMQKLAAHEFVVIGEMAPPAGGAADQAILDAAVLKDDGASAVLIGQTSSPRAQVSPTSLAVLVQQRVPNLEAILTVATWEKSVMSLQADLLGAYAFGVRHVRPVSPLNA